MDEASTETPRDDGSITMTAAERDELYRFTLHMYISSKSFPALHRFIGLLTPSQPLNDQ